MPSNGARVGQEWRKALASASGDCVEVAMGQEWVLVRDSKDPRGSVLRYTHPEWAAFIVGVKSGEFDIERTLREGLPSPT